VEIATESREVSKFNLLKRGCFLTKNKGGEMKKILKSSVLAAAIIGCGATGALATPALYDWAFNIDGVLTVQSDPGDGTFGYDLTGMPVTGTLDATTDLGALTWTTSVAGDHTFLAFLDYEIDESADTFWNESGSVVNVAALSALQSWEIDDPWDGDIYWNVYDGGPLSGSVDVGAESDISIAMGWDFSLAAGDVATITLTISDSILDLDGFYLWQYDPDSDKSIYFSSSLNIIPGGDTPVPEPATMLLMGAGLVGLLGVNRRKKNK